MNINIRTIFRRFFITISLILVLLLITVLALMFFGVNVDLGFLKGGVEASARSALGRDVEIRGPVVLEFSDWPALEVQDVRVANVPGASSPDFLHAGMARLQVGLFPLLKGDIQIGEIKAENVSLNLESDEQGQPNWVFSTEEDETQTREVSNDKPVKTPSQEDRETIRFSLIELTLKEIGVTYHDAALNKTIKFELDKLNGQAAPGKPIILDLEGQLQKKTYDLEFEGGSIEELLTWAKPWQFKLKGEVIGKKIKAEGNLALRDNEPEANFEFTVKDIDIGSILSRLRLVEGLRASTGSMGIKLSLSGNSLQKMVQQSSMAFSVNDGMWRIKSPTSEAYLDVNDLNGGIFVEQGNAITMKLAGRVDEFPVKFVITGAPLVEYVSAPKTVPLTIDVEFADSLLSFAGELAMPVTSRNLTVSLAFDTASLDNLNEVLELDLPPVGPIAFETRFQLLKKGYDLPKLNLQVGESRLAGKMNLDMSTEKPKVNVELISELFRIDDFDSLRKKPEEGEQPEDTEPQDTAEEVSEKQDEEVERNLLSPEILGSLDADLLVEAKQVTSGEDNLGSGILKVSLKDGRLAAEPLRLYVPGGGVQVDFDYLPTTEDVTFNLKSNIDKFDIGIMTRRLKPESDMGGSFTLDAALHSTAPDQKSIMEHANGHFDFVLVPQNFSAGIIDLWAVNLLSAIMTEVSEKEQSEINCVVVRFGIEEGLMEEKAIYMDTSNMRVAGKAEINFRNRELYIMMAPKAKNPEFFSLAVPIKIKGKFDDFGFGIGIIRLTSSLVSFITSPIHVPIRRIFVNEIPEDGQEACRQAWTITGEEK